MQMQGGRVKDDEDEMIYGLLILVYIIKEKT